MNILTPALDPTSGPRPIVRSDRKARRRCAWFPTAVFPLALIAALILQPAPVPAGELDAALASLQTTGLVEHVRTLASDAFEGRAPATRGEELTVAYLADHFRRLGLRPGNPDGTFVQRVPLMGIASESSVEIQAGGRRLEVSLPGEAIATSLRFDNEVHLTNTEVVFVGYGVVAPEYGWDDYKGVDVRGKTILMLVNDPPVPDPADPSRLDERMFKGKAMTYYGRWTYKYEIAAEKGAAAALIIHETGPAGYPYFVLVSSHARENFDLQSADGNRGKAG